MSAAISRWSLSGRNVVVTGGTKGIGLGLCSLDLFIFSLSFSSLTSLVLFLISLEAVVEEALSLGACVFTIARNQEQLDLSLKKWAEMVLILPLSLSSFSQNFPHRFLSGL